MTIAQPATGRPVDPELKSRLATLVLQRNEALAKKNAELLAEKKTLQGKTPSETEKPFKTADEIIDNIEDGKRWKGSG